MKIYMNVKEVSFIPSKMKGVISNIPMGREQRQPPPHVFQTAFYTFALLSVRIVLPILNKNSSRISKLRFGSCNMKAFSGKLIMDPRMSS